MGWGLRRAILPRFWLWLVVKVDVPAGADHALLHCFGRRNREPRTESLNEYPRFIVFFQNVSGWETIFSFSWDRFTGDIKRFFSTLPNGIASFVASSLGDVFTKIVYTNAGAHIDVPYRVINTASATSFFCI